MNRPVLLKSANMQRPPNITPYLRDLDNSPRFSRAEEAELCTKVKNGDTQARNQLLVSMLHFIVMMVKPWRSLAENRGIPFEDLIQQANVECLEYLNSGRFDPAKGRLTTIIGWRIRRVMYQAIYGGDQTIRVPLYLRYKPNHRYADKARKAIGTVPMMNRLESYSAKKNDNRDTSELFDLVFARLVALKERLTHQQTENWERNVNILLLYYRDGLKYCQISRCFGISRERVRQIIDMMLEYLRNERLEECLTIHD